MGYPSASRWFSSHAKQGGSGIATRDTAQSQTTVRPYIDVRPSSDVRPYSADSADERTNVINQRAQT